MSQDSRIQQLLDDLFDKGRTPEEVCAAYPHLLAEVRERWRKIRLVEADLDAIFPPPEPDASAEAPTLKGAAFPNIPGYELEAILGRGGMGIVFRARDTRLKRLVALKMVLAGEYAGPQERLRFQREAEAVAGLRHPNIVQIHDIGDSDGRPYFTMEYVEGGSLAHKLAGTPQPSRDAASLVATLAIAVQAAHTSGIVHRDLKPANVLLTLDGSPKISDFGLARRVDGETALTRTGVPVGTPSYMAPEQAVGSAIAGPAVDVYALGAILYEMLTGRPPFLAETSAETIQQVIVQDPVSPSRLNATVPRDLETICLKCLRKEPMDRYVNAAALADDLYRFLRKEAIAARPEGRLERLVRRVRRRPGISAAVIVISLLAAIILGGAAWTISEREATVRAAEVDLQVMEKSLRESSWTSAKAAWERATGRLGDRGPQHLHTRLNQGGADLRLAETLETIRFNIGKHFDGKVNLAQTDRDFAATFREANLGQIDDDPEVVARRVRASNISNALLASLDHWSACTQDARQRNWVLAVASKAEPEPTDWRDRARDPAVRNDPDAIEKLIENAPIEGQSVTLLVALSLHMKDSKLRMPFLARVRRAHPGDLWANLTLGDAHVRIKQPGEAIQYYQAVTALRPDLFLGYNQLGMALLQTGRFEEAIESLQKAIHIDPRPGPAHLGLCVALTALKKYDDAVVEFEKALRFRPDAAVIYSGYGATLEAMGKLDEAVAKHRQAVALEPTNVISLMEFRRMLLRHGRFSEARAPWAKALETKPSEHGEWYGYAELCLYLGQEEEYRRGRQALLAHFGASTDLHVAERTARACLLLPTSREELRQAALLAGRAAAADRTKHQGAYPFFQFVRGLAEYRQGEFEKAIAIMRGDAARVPTPAPRLVLAMALHQSGKKEEARKIFVAAVLNHDWRPHQVRDQDGWIVHVLRREAESMILPNLPAFLAGSHQPQDNDERFALIGVCQATDRSLPLARLYAECFAAPNLTEGFRSSHRFKAACAAALAGCGVGDDAAKLPEHERATWRAQAQQWLRADLNALKKILDNNPASPQVRNLVRNKLTPWQTDPDLVRLREPSELLKLSADERSDCMALWDEVRRLVNASQAK
jgi:serine/threonine-protein kinase